MAKTSYPSVDEYIKAQPAASQAVLAKVRAAIRKALPADAVEEVISYQIPGYRLKGGGQVVFFAAWKEHYSVYPAVGKSLDEIAEELAPYKASKGTLRFSLAGRVPVRLIAKVAQLRLRDALARKSRTKKARRFDPPGHLWE